MDRDTKIRNLAIDGASHVEIASKFNISSERVRQIVNHGEHPKYRQYCYHNHAVNRFTDTLKRIERELEERSSKGKIVTRLYCNIKTANAIAELLDTWKPTSESDQCECAVCKSEQER